jgi:uncharacterized protein YutE (UPF0331/DUF86 family)
MIDRGLLTRKLSNLQQALDELTRYAPSTLAQYRTDTLRNRLVHDYNQIDDEIVYAAAAGARELYQQYLESVMTFLTRQDERDAGDKGYPPHDSDEEPITEE